MSATNRTRWGGAKDLAKGESFRRVRRSVRGLRPLLLCFSSVPCITEACDMARRRLLSIALLTVPIWSWAASQSGHIIRMMCTQMLGACAGGCIENVRPQADIWKGQNRVTRVHDSTVRPH